MDKIIEYIKKAFAYIKNLIVKVIDGIIKFEEHIVNWFASLHLIKNKQVPFIANKDSFKEMIKNAPVRHVDGIFEGVYDLEADEIIYNRYLDTDDIDEKTKETLGNEPLVVLQ